jgi:transcriptional regulator with XRE-family HTH domain
MDYKDKFKKLTDELESDPEYQFEGLQFALIEKILEVMEKKQISNSQLAQKLNCSNAYITKLFKGKQNLTLRKIFEIVTALDCSFDFLITELKQQYLGEQWNLTTKVSASKLFSDCIILKPKVTQISDNYEHTNYS